MKIQTTVPALQPRMKKPAKVISDALVRLDLPAHLIAQSKR